MLADACQFVSVSELTAVKLTISYEGPSPLVDVTSSPS